MKHGLYSRYTTNRLAELAARFREDPDLLSLRDAIALQQAIITDLLRQNEGSEGIDPETAALLVNLTERIGRNIERLAKIEQGEKYVLQVEDVQKVVRQVVAILEQEIGDAETLKRIARRLEGLSV